MDGIISEKERLLFNSDKQQLKNDYKIIQGFSLLKISPYKNETSWKIFTQKKFF